MTKTKIISCLIILVFVLLIKLRNTKNRLRKTLDQLQNCDQQRRLGINCNWV